MTINITNRIGQHKISQRITQKQNTDLSYHTGSCMAHLNCLPPRAVVAHLVVGVGIKQDVRCC